MRSGACGDSFLIASLFPVKYEARSSAENENGGGGARGLSREKRYVKEKESESSGAWRAVGQH